MKRLKEFSKADQFAFMGSVNHADGSLPSIYYFSDELASRFYQLVDLEYDPECGDNAWMIYHGEGLAIGYNCNGEDFPEINWSLEHAVNVLPMADGYDDENFALWLASVVNAVK